MHGVLPCARRCGRCDRLGIGSARGLCWECLLADRVEELRARAGPQRGARLAGYLDALAASPNAASTLRWMDTPSFSLLEAVVDGRLELSHRAFDRRQGDQGEGSAVAYLRAALVAHAALPDRDETSAAFHRWLARTLAGLPDGPDHAQVTAFATWQIGRRLAETTARHQGTPPPSAVKHARTQVREAIRLTQWLHTQALDLGDLRQDLLDEWLATGVSTRRSISGFIDWLGRAHPASRRLQVTWPPAAHNPPIASDEQRLQALTVLLADHHVAPRVRFAAASVLLFAQPLTRVAALHRSDVTNAAGGWLIRFGPRPVHAPALLDALLEDLTSTVQDHRGRQPKRPTGCSPAASTVRTSPPRSCAASSRFSGCRSGRDDAARCSPWRPSCQHPCSPSTSASTVPAPHSGHAPPDEPTPTTSPLEPSLATDKVPVAAVVALLANPRSFSPN